MRKVAGDDYLIRTFAVNTCTRQRALNVAVHFRPLSGDWKTEGFFPVPPNGIALMAESTNRNYYLSAQRSDGRAEIGGDKIRDMPAGGIGRFRTFGVADWGDVFHRGGC
ncbi:hypothetical protein SAMN04488093_102389 [Tropicibacter naphthalenivorans]|uniref:Uncharacterized protein n=1 Tax=Tropicibacter naphthalenivorans TaxID=441103 RepID=A0A0P1G5C2_9RHOB|nr:hypothetical protein TRN7648_01229 [Tropicibacter naphthalenivorans]SMC61824.1 hypothetical protein SAMN04488093_102389 [Tropicibacter naphthalenivorans]